MNDDPFTPDVDARIRQAIARIEARLAQTIDVDDLLRRVKRGAEPPRQRRWLPRLRRARAAQPADPPGAAALDAYDHPGTAPGAADRAAALRRAVEVATGERRPFDADEIDLDAEDDHPDPGIAPVTLCRVARTLECLTIRYLSDGTGGLLALWERHSMLFALEGPAGQILVMRARPHATLPLDWADRAYRAVNEWNHSRRFAKAYVGEANERGQLPVYAEIQVPLMTGVHDALLVELVDCASAVAMGFVDWLYDEGALL